MNLTQPRPADRHFPANRGLKLWLPGGPRRSRLVDVASGYNADVATADSRPGLGHGPAGRPGGLDFNGTDQSATVAYRAALATAGVSTWYCWVRPRSFPGVGQDYVANLWSNETGATPSVRWGIGKGTTAGDNKRVGVNFITAGPTDNEAVSGTDLAADVWTWVGVTTDLTTVSFYYFGVLESSAAFTAVPRASTDNFRVGAAALGGGGSAERRYDGLAADLRYHPGVCLEAESMRLAFADSLRRLRRALRAADDFAGVSVPTAPPAPTSETYTNVTGAAVAQRSLIDGRLDLLAQRIYKR